MCFFLILSLFMLPRYVLKCADVYFIYCLTLWYRELYDIMYSRAISTNFRTLFKLNYRGTYHRILIYIKLLDIKLILWCTMQILVYF